MDWDDLRFFLAVADAGSLADAAHELRVSYSTVSRRLNALEDELDTRLFERQASGYVLTSAGKDMLGPARRMCGEFEGLSRKIQGRDARLSGTVRVATTDALATLVMPEIACFTQRFADIEVDLIATPEPTEFAMREADVALLVTPQPPEHLAGRRLARLQSALYASREYLAHHSETAELDSHVWVGWERGMSHIPVARWMREHHPTARVACRVSTGTALLEAVRRGIGVAHVLCFLVADDPTLTRIRLPEPSLETGLWLLTHEDLRSTARIRAFLDFIAEAVGSQRDRYESAGQA